MTEATSNGEGFAGRAEARATLEGRAGMAIEASRLRLPFLGIEVTPMTATKLVEWIVSQRAQKHLLLNHNLHSAYLHDTSRRFRLLYENASVIVIDGAPILWFARQRAKRKLDRTYRIGSTDWFEELRTVNPNLRLHLVGGTPEVNLAARVSFRHASNMQVSGIDGYQDDRALVQSIKGAHADLVLVGMGMPRQEKFLQEYWGELPDAIYATVGGAIDYSAGVKPLAPRWMGVAGIEWLWRLAHDPRRLARRYLAEPSMLVIRRALKLGRAS